MSRYYSVQRSTEFIACLIILFLSAGKTTYAQTGGTLSLGGWGSLKYSETTTTTSCSPPEIDPLYFTYTYTGFVYVDQDDVSHSISGTAKAFRQVGSSTKCQPTAAFPITLTSQGLTMTFIPTTTGGASVTLQPVLGFVNPKYVILGVTYAPPGPGSNVTYTSSTAVGNTTTVSSSFSKDVGVSVSVTDTINAWAVVGGATVMVTGSEATDITQASNSSTMTTITKTTTVDYKTVGTGNAFSPVNHDYDTIWLWLNPLALFTVVSPAPAPLVQWNGYGYDNNDVQGPDIVGIQVGWLNGDFGTSASVATILARGWVTKNEPNMTWPAGDGPGITSTDIVYILGADPFTNPSYSLPSPLPSNSADGRFTQIPYPPNPVTYLQAGPGNGGGTTTGYSLENVDSSTQSNGTSHTTKQSFGLEANFKGGTWLTSFTVNLQFMDTLTWTNSWQNTLTKSTSLTDALSITGPGCPQTAPPCVPAYTGPGEFIVFQDNLYGTFMFYPGN